MKNNSNLTKKIASVVASSLAILGTVGVVTANKTNASKEVSNSKENLSNKQLKPKLVLSYNLASDEYNLNSIQGSHGSHGSHSSHGSHGSHASHGSSSI